MPAHFAIRARTARRLLSTLRADQATGPDDIGAVFLRRLADVLDVPVAMLCRRIFTAATWPKKWQLHQLVPIFKKGSVYLPSRYRGNI